MRCRRSDAARPRTCARSPSVRKPAMRAARLSRRVAARRSAAGAAIVARRRTCSRATTPRVYGRSRLRRRARRAVQGEPSLAGRAPTTFSTIRTRHAVLPAESRPAGWRRRRACCAPTARPTRWNGGVGPAHSIVAFSAICAHKLAYPTREVSFIRFQRDRSPTSDGNVIHCCADHSVYDPAAGARVCSGPAPQPLAAILLDYDAERDELSALGTVGAGAIRRVLPQVRFQAGARVRPGQGTAAGRRDDRRARADAILPADDPVLAG